MPKVETVIKIILVAIFTFILLHSSISETANNLTKAASNLFYTLLGY